MSLVADNIHHESDDDIPIYQDGKRYTSVGGFPFAVCASGSVYLAMIKTIDNELKGRFFTLKDGGVSIIKDVDASNIMSEYHNGWDIHFNRTADKLVVCRNRVEKWSGVSQPTWGDNDIMEYDVSFKTYTIQLNRVIFSGQEDDHDNGIWAVDYASFVGYNKDNQLCYCYWDGAWITNNGAYLPSTGYLLGVFPQYKACYYLTNITSNIYHENDAYHLDHWNSTHRIAINGQKVQATYSAGVMTKDITWGNAVSAANSQMVFVQRNSPSNSIVGFMPIQGEHYGYLNIIEDRFNNLHVFVPPFSFYVLADGRIRDDSKVDEFYFSYNTNQGDHTHPLQSINSSGVI